jgi:N-acetyl-gamma-glutamyl-phosphate reductase
VAGALSPEQLVVDLGADFRLADPAAFERYYRIPHAGTWTYGLPELPGARERIAASRRIANPGCYPTAVALGLAPLLAAGLVEAEDIVVVAASGTSGAGRKPAPGLLGSEVMGDVAAYKIGGAHQHTPEITQSLTAAAGRAVTISFTPLLAPMPRGILATSTARLRAGVDTAALRDCLDQAYAAEPFVHLLTEGQLPHTAATAGSNAVHLAVAADPAAGRAVVVSAIDNLGKGAAGQAVQNANIALGLPETMGLTALGVAP